MSDAYYTIKLPTFSRLAKVGQGLRKMWALSADPASSIVVAEADQLRALQDEDVGWSRVTGGGVGSIQPWDQGRMQEIVLRLAQRNHMARRLLSIAADFIAADGTSIQAKTDDDSQQELIQIVIDRFWDDPINAMDRNNHQRVFEWGLWGEICMPVMRNEWDGRIRLGWITPTSITDVRSHPLTGQSDVVVLTDTAARAVGMKELKIISRNPETDVLEGDCFYRAKNGLYGGNRGISDLFTGADWLNTLDNTLRALADRAKLDSFFIWDITAEGWDEDKCDAYAKTLAKTPVRPNSHRVHNEKFKWEAVSPTLGSADNAEHFRLIKTFLLGGMGIPNHWYGSGDDANRATASVMSEPTRKNLRRQQKQWEYLLADVIEYVLHSAQVAGNLAGVKLEERPFEVRIPDISGPDIAKTGAAMVQITNAVTVAQENGWISHDTAMELFAAIAAETGLEIDPAKERNKVKEDESAENDRERNQAAEREAMVLKLMRGAQEKFGGAAEETA